MIKRTLLFSSPAHLKTKDEQLVFEHAETGEVKSVPIEDIGVVVLEHKQITISAALLAKLIDNNAAVVTCDDSHLPNGLFMPLQGHSIQTARMRTQIEASIPLTKQLWQQTVQAKIKNQAAVLAYYNIPIQNMLHWAAEVRSGDPDNFEARAAAYYWKNIFGVESSFNRERFGEPPNNFLNYAYAILRACVARSLVGSGLLPTFGIHHKNQYNAYCLADDIMEPFRPYADKLVRDLINNLKGEELILSPASKKQLLNLPIIDVSIENKTGPLMVGLQTTTASLAACFEKRSRKISYPEM